MVTKIRFVLGLLAISAGTAFGQTPSTGHLTLSRSLAQVCYQDRCYPILLGAHTPDGTYPIQHARVLAPGYGGDVLAFGTRIDGVPLAIHRVWLLNPQQRRLERLQGPVTGRVGITGGCVNVLPEVYQFLVDCCSQGSVTITP